MNGINPFQDAPFEKAPAAKSPPPAPSYAPITNREALRIAREVASEANAGRSSYTVGMLVIVTISCAAILGVCGTSLQDMLTDSNVRNGALTVILCGMATGVVSGALVGGFVRFATQTIFLSAMMGGLLGAITTPAAVYAENSPTAALAAAAIIGPLLILSVSYLFAKLSRRPNHRERAPAPTSPWDPLPNAENVPTAEVHETAEEATPTA
jgi:hypothetical protein